MQTCSICLEILENRDINYAYPCGHAFHAKCLKYFKEKNGECALCRTSIKIEVKNKHLLKTAFTPAINLNTVYKLPDITENFFFKKKLLDLNFNKTD
jgi:hypothetical protein